MRGSIVDSNFTLGVKKHIATLLNLHRRNNNISFLKKTEKSHYIPLPVIVLSYTKTAPHFEHLEPWTGNYPPMHKI